ncbi:MAG TPA: AraC family transcriptional regulator [Polyangiaceae bacterium]|jgi:AraC-like DNA-binding protein|nr:AraC family transcriptional regulator [Polyangiaceae bacterium]
MAPAPATHHHTVPVTLLRQLIELLERWHIPKEELLAGSAVTFESLEDPFERLAAETMNELLQRARELTGEPALGYYLGLQKRASAYGFLGFAVTSASTLGQALDLALRYAPMHSTANTLELRREGDVASLHIHEHMDFGPARDIVVISLMVGIHAIACSLTARQPQGDVLVEVALPVPDYPAKVSPLLPTIRFGQPANRIVFDAARLDAPILTADGTALSLAQTLCERALEELGFDAELVERVRRLVVSGGNGFRSLEEVAKLLHMSPRTLKRRLAARAASFSAIVDQERREQALVLLRQPRLSIDDVAERLDYSTASTFVRAFQRWMGTTPAAYRRVVYRGATYTR